ncbi:Retrovirus-related Pol polyprotein from transposon TNT 1-94 [Cucumis melo var. makuwa]|uniref:Retrovirus-related Pol polyprotein from transposon TNT 1-94 n=1 Tax=Cucumis melo var. makuwa TaxID=1194695 RepID=A0A5D3BSM8_CUCMM|nr:Retrovirus-related Pol polyprotein from transposon TNT 1-94 [Cucumis melo var. makuwa]TYK02683.1 Retrovirus-related Pol polyprotein from transposon TNT 1-94 [Cucumis melo var. makuwa]
MSQAKSVSSPLPSHFKLSSKHGPSIDKEKEDMSNISKTALGGSQVHHEIFKRYFQFEVTFRDGKLILVGTMHIDVRYHWLRDALNGELFELEKTHTDHNGFDMLIKNLPRSKLELCRSTVGMTSSSSK